MNIPFNKAFTTGQELPYIAEAIANNQLSGDGAFTDRCQGFLEQMLGAPRVLLTHSCTAALEMTALLCGFESGDEVIMPSYTFVSTANAFLIHGAIPVFVDIREDTLNIDESLIESAITTRTKAIVVVHYAGVACEMDTICKIAKKHNLLLIEDAAQALDSTYKDKKLGTIGDFGTFSFHETKNVVCGEGGAIVINNASFIERAEIIRQKGTNRAQFIRGMVDKYSWVDKGSSFLPGEITAAFLLAQLESHEEIKERRLAAWNTYLQLCKKLSIGKHLTIPSIPVQTTHNGHMFYVVSQSAEQRNYLLEKLNHLGIGAVFHYVPLHSSPVGLKYCKTTGRMANTDRMSGNLIRLPLWIGVEPHQPFIINTLASFLN